MYITPDCTDSLLDTSLCLIRPTLLACALHIQPLPFLRSSAHLAVGFYNTCAFRWLPLQSKYAPSIISPLADMIDPYGEFRLGF